MGHAFEDVPKVAAESPLGGEAAPPSEPIAEAAPAPVEAAHVAEDAASKEDDNFAGFFASIQTIFQPGDGKVENHEAEATPSSESSQGGAAAAQHTIHPEGLDQDHVEEMVLGGTAVLAQP